MKILAGTEFIESLPALRNGTQDRFEEDVRPIVEGVRCRGDAAVADFTREFDGVALSPGQFEVTAEERAAARAGVSDGLIQAITEARDNVTRFHEKAAPKSWFTFSGDGTLMGQVVRPLDRVGIYAPGGTAAYPSSVIMGAVPARVAGVRETVLCTPPDMTGGANLLVLVAADLCGVTRIFKVGGAQAVASMAFGTRTIPRVRKIVGPGNAYVAAAKKLVYGSVDVDLPAGPSEVMVIAGPEADPDLIAADLLAQAEHDPFAQAILVTTSEPLAARVQERVASRLKDLPRRHIAGKALDDGGRIVIARDLGEAVLIANAYGPEHLQILLDNGLELLPRLENAGCIFIGPWSPAAAGDYGAGPNHVLPTGGAALSFSPLSTSDFVKVSNVAALSQAGFEAIRPYATLLARAEGLAGHANSLQARGDKP